MGGDPNPPTPRRQQTLQQHAHPASLVQPFVPPMPIPPIPPILMAGRGHHLFLGPPEVVDVLLVVPYVEVDEAVEDEEVEGWEECKEVLPIELYDESDCGRLGRIPGTCTMNDLGGRAMPELSRRCWSLGRRIIPKRWVRAAGNGSLLSPIPELRLAVAIKGNRKGSTATATTLTRKQCSTSVWNGKRPQTKGGGGDEGMAQQEEGSKRYEGDAWGGLVAI